MKRVHIKDGVRFAFIDLYLDKDIYDLAPERFNATTVIPVMDELGVDVTTARQILTIGIASPEAANHLGIACGMPWPRWSALPAIRAARWSMPPAWSIPVTGYVSRSILSVSCAGSPSGRARAAKSPVQSTGLFCLGRRRKKSYAVRRCQMMWPASRASMAPVRPSSSGAARMSP